jgi:hypothetical protein
MIFKLHGAESHRSHLTFERALGGFFVGFFSFSFPSLMSVIVSVKNLPDTLQRIVQLPADQQLLFCSDAATSPRSRTARSPTNSRSATQSCTAPPLRSLRAYD